ncbi:MAG: RagB/SusD family nutrient uptake outer membrane protein [Longimicrobiales bacterium]
MNRQSRSWAVFGTLAVLGACNPDLTVPSLNNPVQGGPATRSTIVTGAQALLGNARTMSTQGVRYQGMWGRESYDLRSEEPRPYTDNLIGPRDPLSSNSGAYFNYGALVNVRAVLNGIENVSGMTEAEKEGVLGWAKTVAAFAYFQTAQTYPEWGAPADAPESPTGALVEIATAEQLYARSLALFDEAVTHLNAAGATFAFQMTPGYAGFNTPATFVRVNRALKARTLKYMGRWQDALTALQQSFIDPAGAMTLGVQHTYLGAPEANNPYFVVANDWVHPRIRAGAQNKADGTPDNRLLAKVRTVAPVTIFQITVSDKPTIAAAQNSTFPWIRNEELLLLRAEANLALGNTTAALADVNIVRQRSGGLAALTGTPTAAQLLDEILYNKRYSLFWEGGFTYQDAFQYNKLGELPKALPTHRVFNRQNWPSAECLQRAMTTGPCGSVTGQ